MLPAGIAMAAPRRLATAVVLRSGRYPVPGVHRQAFQACGTKGPFDRGRCIELQRPVFDPGTFRQIAAGECFASRPRRETAKEESVAILL